MTTILATIVVIGVLVFVHELGHYLAARSVGIRVERFSVGFPLNTKGLPGFPVEYGFDNLKPQLTESLFSADSGGPETWCLPGKNQGFEQVNTRIPANQFPPGENQVSW